MLILYLIFVYVDNYIWCIYDVMCVYVVDFGQVEFVQSYFNKNKFILCGILVIYYYWDYVFGIEMLIKEYLGLFVWGF